MVGTNPLETPVANAVPRSAGTVSFRLVRPGRSRRISPICVTHFLRIRFVLGIPEFLPCATTGQFSRGVGDRWVLVRLHDETLVEAVPHHCKLLHVDHVHRLEARPAAGVIVCVEHPPHDDLWRRW